jgi:hypothetical protein
MPAGTQPFKWLLEDRRRVPRIVLPFSAAIAVDASLSSTFSIAATSNTASTVTVTNPVDGVTYSFLVTADVTGGNVLTFGTGFRVTGTLTLTASKVMAITFESDGTSLIESSRTVAIT